MITSFYSYKGGVGRTALALEVAVQLAQAGERVTFWDLDLEAPGVQRNPSLAELDQSVRTGTIDVVRAFLSTGKYPTELVETSLLDLHVGGQRSLRFLLPGVLDPDRARTERLDPFDTRYAAIDWAGLFDPAKGPGLALFLRMATQLEEDGAVDHIIVDGRTGVNELAALCAAELPDVVVLVRTAGAQSRMGTQLVREALARRQEMSRPDLRVWTVANLVPTADAFGEVSADVRKAIGYLAATMRREVELSVPFAVRQQVDERPASLAGATTEAKAVAPLVRLLAEELERRRRLAARERDEGRIRRLDSEDRRLRGHDGRDRGTRFEDEVATLFRMQGAEVTTNRLEVDMEIDVWATHRAGTSTVNDIVECKDIGAAGPDVVRILAGKVDQIRRADHRGFYRGIVVSRGGYTKTAPTTAEQEGITLCTLDDLTRELVDLEPEQRAIRDLWSGSGTEALYIEPDVVMHGRAQAGEVVEAAPLRNELYRWLADDATPVFALLGDFGTGKTTFCSSLAAEMAAAAADDPLARVPVLVDLRQTRTTHATLDGLLRAHLDRRQIGAAPAALRQRSRAGHLLLIFDGFDEMLGYAEPGQFGQNLRQILGAAEGGAKVLLTCRTNFFRDRPEELDLIGQAPAAVRDPETTALWTLVSDQPGVEIGYLAPFTADRREQYVRRAAGDGADELLEAMRRTHDLMDLGRVPYLLSLIVRAAPELVGLEGQRITLARLYQVFAEHWFVRGKEQLRLLGPHPAEVVEELARRLWESPDRGMHYDAIAELAASLTREQPTYGPLERDQIDYEIRSALFLTRDAGGYFRFAHRSFHEYFLARRVRARLLAGDTACLNLRPLTKEVVEFLCGMGGSATVVDRCADVLQEPPRRRVTENALIVAHRASRDHGHRADLRGAQLAGTDLGGLDLERADLRDADMSHANLRWATMEEADLSGANLTGAQISFALLGRARLVGTSLRSAAADHVLGPHANLGDADVTGADLSFSRLMSADLRGVIGLGAADLYGASIACSSPGGTPDGTGRYDDPATAGSFAVPAIRSAIQSIAFHPQRSTVLAAATSRAVQIIDVGAGEVAAELSHGAWVRTVAWSPDGTRLASGDQAGMVCIWDPSRGAEMSRVKAHGQGVRSVAWSPDGTRLATVGDDGTLRIADASSGTEIARGRCDHTLFDAAWSPDGRRLATGGRDGTVRLWDPVTAVEIGRFEAQHIVLAVTWSPDGTRLASAGDDGTVRTWNAGTWAQAARFDGHRDWVWSVVWSGDSTRLASGGVDGTVRIWDAATGAETAAAAGHDAGVRSVAWSDDGTSLASGGEDCTVRCWNPESGDETARFEGLGVGVRSIAWSPDGVRFASGDDGGTVQIWNALLGSETNRLSGHRGWVHAVAWSPDGSRLASAGDDGTVRTWDTATGAETTREEGDLGGVWALAWSPDGARVASVGADGTVRIANALTGAEMARFDGHRGGAGALAWSPDGALLASGGRDRTVRCWDPVTALETARLEGHRGEVWTVAWSPDGSRLASGDTEGVTRTWISDAVAEAATFTGHGAWVVAVTWSPDGRQLTSIHADGTRRVWETETGVDLGYFPTCRNWLRAASWSADGSRLASVGQDGTVALSRAGSPDVSVLLWANGADCAALTTAGSARVPELLRTQITVRIGLVNHPLVEIPQRLDDVAVNDVLRSLATP